MTSEKVKEALLLKAKPDRAVLVARFFKTGPGQYGEGDLFLGPSMPEQREVARLFADLSLDEVEKLIHDPYHECRMVGLVIWVLQCRNRRLNAGYRKAIFERYVANRQYINNWDLVDVTCPTIVGDYLSNHDRSLLYDLADEDHLWSQRIAMISTFAFIRKGQFSDSFAIAEKLLSHRHDLIHKAIGWMLREIGKKDEMALEEFLHDHIRQMPRTALRYAIEKFEPQKRREYLDM